MRRILGIVLSGGQSRRFGRDKALALAGNRPLVGHAIASLTPHVETIILCGQSYLGVPGIPDRPISGLGPLGGLNAGLHHALATGYSHVLSIACDTPYVPESALIELTAGNTACVIADHPVVGFWPAEFGPLLDRFLVETDRRSMRGWMRRCKADEIAIDGIANINRPADLEAWLATLPDAPAAYEEHEA